MAHLLVLQCSGRRKGYTATLMRTVVEHLSQKYDDLEIEICHLHDYRFGPCTSCFSCIKNVGSGCVLDDDWGRNGEGLLYQAFKRANGLLIVDPVHSWGVSAAGRTFFERIYPTFWEGVPYGIPFASISCASNQGFQYRAMEEYCKLSASHAFRYIGGLPVHAAYYEEAGEEAKKLAEKLAEAAIVDARDGRKKLTDYEIFEMYNGTPWDIIHGYLQNLTNNTFRYEEAVPVQALASGRVDKPEARELLENVCEHLKKALDYYHAGDRNKAARELALTAKYWTHGSYKQYCEGITVKVEIPETYRHLDEK
ncbi:flavodoxin family protein [Candidatus Latescibacterota bacterium]